MAKLESENYQTLIKNDSIVFDLESIKDADEVGGWNSGNIDQMGFAHGCAYLSHTCDYRTYWGPGTDKSGIDGHIERLLDDLTSAGIIIGFNLFGFDYKVLQPYASEHGIQLLDLPTFDILLEIGRTLKRSFPISLESLASFNLGPNGRKTLNPKRVVQMYRQGYYEEVSMYCRHDVWMTRMLFMIGYYEGKLEMRGRRSKTTVIDCSHWKDIVARRRIGEGAFTI